MTDSIRLASLGSDLDQAMSKIQIPASVKAKGMPPFSLKLDFSVDQKPGGTGDADGQQDDPEVVAFWGKVAVEVAKVAAAGLAAAIGSSLGSSPSNCVTTTTTTVTENADGSKTSKTVSETTCTAA